MPISLDEKLLSVTDACRILPGRPHVSTLWRWISRGVHGHRLETIVVGGRRFTSRESLERFIDATTTSANDSTPLARTPHRRQQDQMRARQVLIKAGIADPNFSADEDPGHDQESPRRKGRPGREFSSQQQPPARRRPTASTTEPSTDPEAA